MRSKTNIPHKMILLFAILTFTFGLSTNAMADGTVIHGVSVGGIDIGGLTKDEATAKIQEYVAGYTSKTAEISVDGSKSSSTVGELGYYWKNKEVVDDAVQLCKQGNIIERFKQQSDVAKTGKNYEIEYDVDDAVLKETIDNYSSQYNVPHVNASLKKDGEGFTYTSESAGRIIDADATVSQFHDYLLNTWNGEAASLEATVVDDYPTATVEDCKKVTSVLGSFTTHFTTGSSNYNRNQNIANGAELLNATVVYPGETFSANALLEPWTEANGWRMAGTFVNGRTEDSLGGGICQVSTTLYNAVLRAELEIVERFNHSMSVGYVPLSQDAALAGTWKDLKFSNNTDAPVYIEAFCSNGSITFNVYGHETRPAGRTLEFITEKLGYSESGETYSARLIKKVYQDGALLSEEVINKSTYEVSGGHGGGTTQPEETTTPAPSTEQPSETQPPQDTQPQTEPPTQPQTEPKTQPQTEPKTTKQQEEQTTKKPPKDDKKKEQE